MEREKDLGRKLGEADANKGKIALMIALRVLVVGFFLVAGFRQSGIAFAALLLIPAIPIAAWPLIHLRDRVSFHEHGFIHRGKSWLFSELGQVTWKRYTGGANLFSSVYMTVGMKNFNFSYVKDGKVAYDRAYLQQV